LTKRVLMICGNPSMNPHLEKMNIHNDIRVVEVGDNIDGSRYDEVRINTLTFKNSDEIRLFYDWFAHQVATTLRPNRGEG